jgi:hypothetical protein
MHGRLHRNAQIADLRRQIGQYRSTLEKKSQANSSAPAWVNFTYVPDTFPLQPILCNGTINGCTVCVDVLDEDSAILHRLDAVGDLDQLARGDVAMEHPRAAAGST